MLAFQQNFTAVEDDNEIMQAIENAISALPSPCTVPQLVQCLESLGLNAREIQAVCACARDSSARSGSIEPTAIAQDAWRVIKTVRSHASAF